MISFDEFIKQEDEEKYNNMQCDMFQIQALEDELKNRDIYISKLEVAYSKELERLNKKILTLEETIRKANNNVLKDISMIKMHEMVKQEIVQRLVETSKILESRSDK